jgi:hypothetical protein
MTERRNYGSIVAVVNNKGGVGNNRLQAATFIIQPRNFKIESIFWAVL